MLQEVLISNVVVDPSDILIHLISPVLLATD
jgi:hypothetical protein